MKNIIPHKNCAIWHLAITLSWASVAFADEDRFGRDISDGGASLATVVYIVVVLLLTVHEKGLLHDWANNNSGLALALFLFIFPALYAFKLLGWVILVIVALFIVWLVFKPKEPDDSKRPSTSHTNDLELQQGLIHSNHHATNNEQSKNTDSAPSLEKIIDDQATTSSGITVPERFRGDYFNSIYSMHGELFQTLMNKYGNESIGLTPEFTAVFNTRGNELVTAKDYETYGDSLVNELINIAKHEIGHIGYDLYSEEDPNYEKLQDQFGTELIDIMKRVSWSKPFYQEELFINQDDLDHVGKDLVLLMDRIATMVDLKLDSKSGISFFFERDH